MAGVLLLGVLNLGSAQAETDEEAHQRLMGIAAKHARLGEFAEANAIWEIYAAKGDLEALCQLGNSYIDGDAVEQDVNRGITMMKDAARQGHIPCQALALYFHVVGEYGMERSFFEAVCWGLPAAAYGESFAQYYIYLASTDLVWLLRSARQGYEPAMELAAKQAPIDGSVDDFSVFLVELAAKGNAVAQERMGWIDLDRPSPMKELVAQKRADPLGFFKPILEEPNGPIPKGEGFAECDAGS